MHFSHLPCHHRTWLQKHKQPSRHRWLVLGQVSKRSPAVQVDFVYQQQDLAGRVSPEVLEYDVV